MKKKKSVNATLGDLPRIKERGIQMRNIKVLGTITLYVEYDIDDRNKIVEIQAVMPGQSPTISWDEKFEEELLSEIEELDDDGSLRSKFTYKEKGGYWLCREYDTYTGDVCDQWKIPHTNWAMDYMALIGGILV